MQEHIRYKMVAVFIFAIVLVSCGLPADVQQFSERRDGCDHFRSEPWDEGDEPDIKERREFILNNIRELCTGTDKELTSLRRKYKDDKSIIGHLSKYEDQIERE